MTSSSTHRSFHLSEAAQYGDDYSVRDVQVQTAHPSNHLSSFLPTQPHEGPPLLSPFPTQPGPSFYHHLSPYSSSGFDILKMMAKVLSRPNPRIMLGPVDMSCSFVVSDARHPDSPIIYASPAFCRQVNNISLSLKYYSLPQTNP